MYPCLLLSLYIYVCVYIRYFIPEDGDLEVQPNVFLAPKPRQPGAPPTLGEIKQAFPLPGRYHFRFKSPLVPGADRDSNKSIAVWMDCTDDRQPVPIWQSQIVAKITRLGVEDDDEEDDDDDEDFRRPTPVSSTPATQQQQQYQQPHQSPNHQQQSANHAAAPAAPSFDLFDGPSTHAPAPASHGYGNSGSSSGSMGGLFDSSPSVIAAAPASGGASLLDMNFQQHDQQHQPPHADFLGMTSAPSPPVSGNFGGFNMQQQQQRPAQQQLRSNSSFDSFGGNNTSSSQGNGAFGDLGTPWK